MRKLFGFNSVRLLVLALVFSMLAIAAPASAEPWKFGIMSDTQWKGGTPLSPGDCATPGSPDCKNPNNVAVNVINHMNQEFINHGVKFVVQVGDLTDPGTTLSLDTTATFRQALYNAGIGFYPLRGNHESSAAGALEFQRIFPQTQTGLNNQTPADAFINDTMYGPQANTNTTFTVGANFNTLPGFEGLTYSFDYKNARFLFLDQFTPPSGASHSVLNSADVDWVGTQLSSRAGNTHAFVFAHKHLISENHADTLFGSNPSVDPSGLQNPFMEHLFNAGVRYHIGGHDHMHNRALVTSPDKASTVQNIITASNSYKFYIPQIPSVDEKYNLPAFGVLRETPIAQELFTVGYYIVTVDGPRVTVDFYSSPNGCNGDCDLTNDVIPYEFTKRETFGYSLNGQEFLVGQGESYTVVQDSSKCTTAKIIGGINGSTATVYDGRVTTRAVNTGWTPKDNGTRKKRDDAASEILTLWGMTDLGATHTDTYVLSMSYDSKKLLPFQLGQGLLGLATWDGDDWVNAVDRNDGGARKFVLGPYKSCYKLGTYGIDPRTRTAWAVINYDGEFAVAGFRHRPFCNSSHN